MASQSGNQKHGPREQPTTAARGTSPSPSSSDTIEEAEPTHTLEDRVNLLILATAATLVEGRAARRAAQGAINTETPASAPLATPAPAQVRDPESRPRPPPPPPPAPRPAPRRLPQPPPPPPSTQTQWPPGYEILGSMPLMQQLDVLLPRPYQMGGPYTWGSQSLAHRPAAPQGQRHSHQGPPTQGQERNSASNASLSTTNNRPSQRTENNGTDDEEEGGETIW